MSEPTNHPPKKSVQILVCASAEQLTRARELFPKLEVRYVNGGDWSEVADRRCVCLGWDVAHYANGYAAEVKVIEAELPADLTAANAMAWAKAHATAYNRPHSAPQQVVASLKVAGNSDDAGPGGDVPPSPNLLPAPRNEPDAVAEPAQIAPESPQGDAIAEDAPPPFDPADDALEARSAVFTVDRDGWPVPVDFWGGETSGLPPISPEMFPGWLYDYIADQSALRGVDPVQPALHCLVAFSGALHNDIGLRPKAGESDYIERPVLWGATIAPPSTKKDAGQAIGIGPLLDIDREMRLRMAAAMEERADAEHKYQEELAAWRKGKQIGPRPVAPEPVMSDRLLVDDFTTEALRTILQFSSRKKVLVVASELAAMFGNADAYSKGSKVSKDVPLLLKLYESKSRIIDRAAPAPPVFVKSWAASISGAIQPISFARIVKTMGLETDGMLQRFLLVISRNATAGEDRPADRAAADNYKRVMGLLVAMHAGAEPCVLSKGAVDIRSELLAWIYRMSGSGVLSEAFANAVGKFEGSFARLCLVMHAAECAQASLPVIAPEVSEATAERVRSLILNLLYPHAAKFYADLNTETNFLKVPALIASYVLHEGARELTATMLWRGLSSWRHMEKRLRDDALRTCCEAGWLRRRGETVYTVNPAVHTMFESQREREKERRARLTALMAEKMGPRRREAGSDDE